MFYLDSLTVQDAHMYVYTHIILDFCVKSRMIEGDIFLYILSNQCENESMNPWIHEFFCEINP